MESGSRRMMRNGAGTVYRIVVRSELGVTDTVVFKGIGTKDGDTILKGKIIDQPQLHGILDRNSGLGLQLLSVPDDQRAGVKREQKESKP